MTTQYAKNNSLFSSITSVPSQPFLPNKCD
uniref:Uncharacterized protein n=1 Tax=Rhizophora mucronata TaxID=61149 RepID=A0A2P2QK86_RHIMU